uniref:DUF721 domain-containing protein n=1 Tax=Candidatus Kentrum sp. DK TaxID=2126562 RepID=A0A450T735_9GAMM|nr:MAG: hypothetical protein BECKDK2373B_GA0170837_11126 [Candidatus Kentron sp. DK]
MLSVADRLSHPGNPLYRLALQAKYLDAVDRALGEHLGPPINRHCRLAAITADTAVLCVDSPAWHSKLRFSGADIARFLREHCGLVMVGKVSIHVDPLLLQTSASEREAPATERLRLSPSVEKLLRNVAHSTNNPGLREAWLRLARHGS